MNCELFPFWNMKCGELSSHELNLLSPQQRERKRGGEEDPIYESFSPAFVAGVALCTCSTHSHILGSCFSTFYGSDSPSNHHYSSTDLNVSLIVRNLHAWWLLVSSHIPQLPSPSARCCHEAENKAVIKFTISMFARIYHNQLPLRERNQRCHGMRNQCLIKLQAVRVCKCLQLENSSFRPPHRVWKGARKKRKSKWNVCTLCGLKPWEEFYQTLAPWPLFFALFLVISLSNYCLIKKIPTRLGFVSFRLFAFFFCPHSFRILGWFLESSIQTKNAYNIRN